MKIKRKLKLQIKERLAKENFSIYFHQSIEIEFDDTTLLEQVFGPEAVNAQVDVYLQPDVTIDTFVGIISETNIEILEESEIKPLQAGTKLTIDLKRIGYLVSTYILKIIVPYHLISLPTYKIFSLVPV